MMRKTLLLAVLAVLAGCGPRSGREEEARGATAVPAVTGARLADALALLDRELVRALRGRLEGESLDNFVRAEAISDRLLETQFPFEWLRAENYSVQSRLRQVQALADRVQAQIRSGGARDSAYQDLSRLRAEVLELRRLLAQGGGQAPPPLERLLAGRDTLTLQAAEGPGGE